VIGERAGERYALSERLGSGGTSSVWRARDTETGRDVAVKVLHLDAVDSPEAVARFEREARLVASLHCPNIVELLDRGQLEGRPFLVFELVNGVDLREYLRRNSPLDVADAVAVALQVANGLAAAHALRIVHRDLKPGNILIDETGRVRVADFGIARAIEEPGITQAGRVVGTGEYVSPEQALGKTVDERCDLYALGVLLFEVLSGRPPFRGSSFADVAARHVRAPVPSLTEARPDTPPEVATLVTELLAKSPGDRPASADVVRDRLRRVLVGLGASGPLVETALDRSLDSGPVPPPVTAMTSHLEDMAPWEEVTPPSMDYPPLTAVPPPEAPPYRVPPSARENSGATRWAAVGALIVAVVALAIVLLEGGSGNPATTNAGQGTSTRLTSGAFATTPRSATTKAHTTATLLALQTDVATFDPPPGGDDSENDDQAANAIDGDPTTWWETETYKTNDLRHGKGGVGLIVSPQRAGRISTVEIQTPSTGITVSIYVAPGAATPQVLSGWKLAAGPLVLTRAKQRVELRKAPKARHILIWISTLEKAPGGGGYSARIAEVRLFGPPAAAG
jgi:serine/threonine-protein kinase